MKKLVLFLLIAISMFAQAQTKPAPTPPDAASVAVALAAASVILPVAIITGKRDALCTAMGGQYFPNSDGLDQCPGGRWSALIGIRGEQDAPK